MLLSSTPSRQPSRFVRGRASRSGSVWLWLVGFSTVIGIDSSELHAPQPVRISLAIGVPAIRACTTDRIEDTINYAAVREALHALLATHRVRLLEALAEQIAQLLIADFGAHWVRVMLAKPGKFEDVASVGVAIERRREAHPRETGSVLTLIASGLVPGHAQEKS